MNIGALEFEFLANIAKLRQDMDDAKKAVGGASEFIKGMVDGAGKALMGLAAGLSVGAFAGWIKGAINAADETSKLAQRMGVATEDVGGLQLAFDLGGSSAQGMVTAFSKLSKNAAENSDAFKNLGIETRNVDGTVRGTKELFYDVADAFQEMEAGAVKSAYAQELFGKSGAELLPLLNGGSEGLRDMAEKAEKLGLVISDETGKAAEEFNDTLDLLQKSGSGVATQLAAKLLPSLNAVVGGFLEVISKGDYVTKTADAIGAAMKGLYTVGSVVAEVFNTLGKTAGAAVAQIVAVMRGDFQGALQIGKEWTADIKKDWTGTVKNLGEVWDNTAGETAKALGAVSKATKGATYETKEQKKAVDEAAKAYETFDKKLKEAAADLQNNLAQNDKLSASQKLLAALTSNNTAEVQRLTDKRRGELIEQAKQNVAMEAEIKQRDLARRAMEETGKENDKFTEGIEKNTEAIIKRVQQAKEDNAVMLLSKEQLAQLEIQKLLDAAAQAERNAQDAESRMLGSQLVEEYTKQAQGLRDLAKLKGDKVHLEAAKEANEAWKATSEEIGKSFTDSLFRAFEQGKSFGEALMDGLKNLFKTTVLKLIIQPVQNGLNSAIGSLFGGAGGAGAGGLGSLVSLAQQGYSMLTGGLGSSIGNQVAFGVGDIGQWLVENTGGYMNTLGGSLMQNSGMIGSAAGMLGNGFAGYGISKALSGGYSAGSAVNTIAGIASAIPGIGPIAGVIGGIINRAFGRKPKEVTAQGIEGSIMGGDATGRAYAEWQKKGGWFRSTKRGTDYSDMNEEVAAALDLGASTLLAQTTAYATALGLPAEHLSKISTSFRVQLTDDEKKNQEGIAQLLTNYQDALTGNFAGLLAPFQKAGETLTETFERLAGLQVFSEQINEFGGIFSRIANLSIDAKEQLISFSGGLEAFIAKTQAFVDQYYTQDEKAGLQAAQLLEVFKSIGLDGSALGSREDFRALVEAQAATLDTEAGRKTLAALLDIGPSFATLADYLKENGLSLEDAAQSAPQVEVLNALLEKQGEANSSQAAVVSGQEQTNTLLGDIYAGITAGNQAIVDGLANVGNAMYSFANGLAEAQSRPITEMNAQ